jgi:subtilisin family serine protease
MFAPIRALATCLFAIVLIATTAVSAQGIQPPSTNEAATSLPTTAGQGATNRVTLITGDVVTLSTSSTGNTATVVTPVGAPASARIIETGGDLYVYPDSALPLVAAGALDKHLFDVSQLVADGYADANSATLPLIITYTNAKSARLSTSIPDGAARLRTFTSIDGTSVAETRTHAAEFWEGITDNSSASARSSKPRLSSNIAKVWLDGKVTASLAQSTAQIGAPDVWTGGDTGQGVTVAVIDTGIDSAHPDFVGRIKDSASFVPNEDTTDRNGHGTHVASTIAGTGAASNGLERGVAPSATLDIAKVLGDDGSGQDSWVIAGMEWAAREEHARIISMSLGSDPSDGSDPTSQAVDNLSKETGALFIIAAGNSGAPNTIAAPGAATDALTVGAVDSNDDVADFSSQGPRLGDALIKPEISAPGVDILAARSQFATEGSGYYQTLSGTSMATPHVAGAAALLLEAHPDLTGPELKDDLIATSKATPSFTPFQAGNGRVDIAATVASTVFATGTASAGRVDSSDTDPVNRPITYTNIGSEPVTLHVAIAVPGAPDGLFALSSPTVTVPAHGTATATLTISPALGSISASYTGELNASSLGGTDKVRTAIAVGATTHALTLTLKDFSGAPGNGTVELLSAGEGLNFIPVNGTTTIYLPDASYSAMMFTDVPGTHGPDSLGIALLGNPDITLDENKTIVFDSSKVQQIETLVPQPTTDSYRRLDYFRSIGDQQTRSFRESSNRYDSVWTVPTSGRVTHGEFDLTARWRKEQAELSVSSSTHKYSDLTRQLGETQLPQGTHNLPLVYAGTGATADYAKIKGARAVAVVRRNSTVTDRQQAQAAIAAGVKLLIVENNAPGLAQRDYVLGAEPSANLEIALVSTDEGELLIRQAKLALATVTVASQLRTKYVYDLVQTFHNSIPRNLVKREDRTTLARIDEDFSSATPGKSVGEFRFDWPTFNDWGIGGLSSRPLRSTRTDWVTSTALNRWGQEAYVTGRVVEIAAHMEGLANSTSKARWYKPITRPYLNDGYQSPARTDDGMRIDVPGFGGGDHVGLAQSGGMVQTVSLFQGENLISTRTGAFTTATALPDEELPYRFEVKTSQTAALGKLSPSTTTEWNFTSGATTAGAKSVLPMPQLGYEVQANAAGSAEDGSAIAITANQLAETVGGGKLKKPSVMLSYDDGKTWRKSRVVAGPAGTWTVVIDATIGAKYVSLRTIVVDSLGNSVDQTILRAIAVHL